MVGDGGHPLSRKGTGSGRARGGSATSGDSGRPPQDTRRRRSSEQRYVAWGDGIDRVYCARAGHGLPATFPVASHAGAATIAATVVARRPEALLICSYGHCGPHVWPDGEIVAEASGIAARQSERAE